jgi:tetratricopeptide (TPR) repeat protein
VSYTLTAQTSWRKSVKAAESALRQSKFGEAAAFYEQAWAAKPKKKKYIYDAAEYYAMVRNYAKSADCYKNLRDDADYPLAQLYYARMLKQSGAFDKAAPEYADFISNYGGADADKLRDIVQNEIRGCEFAQQSIKAAIKNPLQVNRLPSNVNSDEAEFAPVSFSDDILYFSSNFSGRASIYRSQKQNGNWSRAVAPNGFPELKNTDFCNGAFSPDNKRFYFTECVAEKGLQAICALYLMVRKGDKWSDPMRLPDGINVKGYTSTHPYVSQIGDKEMLYFASNKPDGKGGMDIWLTSRNITSDDLAFSPSMNLGGTINTEGDEITPFFEVSENALFFASNGHLSMGGLDILKSKFSNDTNTWSKVENIGAPINTCADDYYYIKNKSKLGGFVVSNRATKDRQSTTNEDIFEFIAPPKNLMIKGQVLERSNSVVVKEARLNLYEITANGQKRLLNTRVSTDGLYEFVLLPDKKFRVEAEKKGYTIASHEFTAVKDSIAMGFEKNLYLDVEAKPSDVTLSTYIEDTNVKNKPKPNTKPNSNGSIVTNNTKPTTKPTAPSTKPMPNTTANKDVVLASNSTKNADVLTSKGATSVGTMPLYETISKDNEKLITSAPKLDGTYYKIQMIAVKRFDMEETRYRPVKDLGRIDTEYIVKKDMVRVLLADFFKFEDAQTTLAEVRKNREFSGAYIVKYENGTRAGIGK